jgi:hypothetical protein
MNKEQYKLLNYLFKQKVVTLEKVREYLGNNGDYKDFILFSALTKQGLIEQANYLKCDQENVFKRHNVNFLAKLLHKCSLENGSRVDVGNEQITCLGSSLKLEEHNLSEEGIKWLAEYKLQRSMRYWTIFSGISIGIVVSLFTMLLTNHYK